MTQVLAQFIQHFTFAELFSTLVYFYISTLKMAPPDPSIGGFTPEQLSTLTAVLTLQQNESRKFTQLQLAKEQIEITDGNSAVQTRRWARKLDISQLEHDNNDEFTIHLAKITSRADLHESICTAGKTQWSELKEHVIRSFLTGAEDLHHRHALMCVVSAPRRAFLGIAQDSKPCTCWHTPRIQAPLRNKMH